MAYFKVFEIPSTVERELIAFYLKSPHFPLEELNRYRIELSQYYGVYFLYYRGDFELYRDITVRNAAEAFKPIYVGKAVSSGGRTGQTLSKNSLYKRLYEHFRTIEAASTTLHVRDFDARVIPMEAELVSWAESTMIRRLRPPWNSQLSGFGIHDPGSGRYSQRRSIWDQKAAHGPRNGVSSGLRSGKNSAAYPRRYRYRSRATRGVELITCRVSSFCKCLTKPRGKVRGLD